VRNECPETCKVCVRQIVVLEWNISPNVRRNHCELPFGPDSRIFLGISLSVSRPERLSCAETGGWSDVGFLRGKETQKAFAGFGGEPTLALMDAVT